jgi:DNA helicase-2/ATP-dependent DNA helicase PcrA
MTPNKSQNQAIHHIHGPLLVLAGPGTGKTQLLSARIAHILKSTDASPQNILALTYTESGSSNMRTRLATIIGADSHQIHISTYHAFGADLLTQYRDRSPTPDRPLETPIDRITTHKILTQIRQNLPHDDILKTAKISDLIATISELKSARLTPTALTKIATTNLKSSEKINQTIAPLLAAIPRAARLAAALPHYQTIAEALAPFTSPTPITGKVEPEANAILSSLTAAIAAATTSTKPLSKWRDKYFEKSATNTYRLSNTIANKKLTSLAAILTAYTTHLSDNALYDFTDMIEQSITRLKSDAAFRFTLQETYQYILLDEFQDTNDSQFELIRLLTDYDQPNIMAVGDDDQAIFAFQGARYSNLMDFQSHYAAKVITLTENYRSAQPILDFSTHITAQIADRFSTTQNIPKSLTAMKNLASAITRHEFIAAPSEYHWLATHIAALIKSGSDPREIAIIAPKHKYLAPLIPHLHQNNIKITYEKRENILEDPPIAQLLTIARFLTALTSIRPAHHHLLDILSFDFWRLPPLEILTIMTTAKHNKQNALELLESSPNPQIQQIAHFLAALALKSIDSPLEVTMNYLLGTIPLGDYRSPFLAHHTKASDTAAYRLYENLAVLREHLKSRARPDSPLRLRDLVEFADDYLAAEEKLINTSPYTDATAAIRLLSAHSAKGLEFKHVFLIALDNLSWGTSKGNNNTLVLPRNLEYVRHTGATPDEKLRLLFVAITRAKQYLHLTSSKKDFAGKSPARLAYLTSTESTIPIQEDTSTALPLDTLQTHWHLPPHDPSLEPILKDRLKDYRLTATDLTTYIDIIHAGPRAFYTEKILHSPRPYSPTLDYGNFIHATFDFITKTKATDQSALAFYEHQVNSAPLEPTDRAYLLKKGLDNLTIYLKARGSHLRRPTDLSELVMNTALIGTTPARGKIDHLEIDETNRSITIVDYKTGTPKSASWAADPTLYKYQLQLLFYHHLIKSDKKYTKYDIPSARIEFTTPDHAGTIHTKSLTFTPTDLTLLSTLAAAIYQNIRHLTFPDTSHLDPTLANIKKFIDTLTAI